MELSSGLVHKTYRVADVSHLALPVERRLEALGLTEGTKIDILNKKKHGAMIVKIRGTRFALGENITAKIQVEEVQL